MAALRLAMVPGVGPCIRQRLMERFGTAEAVFAAAPSDLRTVERVGPKLCRAIAAADQLDVEPAKSNVCAQHGVEILVEEDRSFPAILHELPDPPGVLFVRGKLEPRDAVAIGIVGSRHATHYGLQHAERLGCELARCGFTVISGLARGIDAAAHRGALAAGGRTIAVLASGVLNIYPPEHVELAEQIVRSGALISESPPTGGATSGNVSAAESDYQRIVAGCLGRGGLDAQWGTDYGTTRNGAGTGGIRCAGADYQPDVAWLPSIDSRRGEIGRDDR